MLWSGQANCHFVFLVAPSGESDLRSEWATIQKARYSAGGKRENNFACFQTNWISLSLTALQPGKTGVVVVKAGEWDRWSLPCTAANHDLSHAGLLQLFSRNGLLWLNRDTIAQFCNSSNLCHKNPQLGSLSSGLLLFHSSGGWRPATSSSPAESWVSQQKKSPNPTWLKKNTGYIKEARAASTFF